MSEDNGLDSAKKRSLKILGNRQMAKSDVKRRLVSKGESEENASETAEWLEKIGAINDSDYATAIVKHYCTKGYGLARVKNELFRRGIPRDMWESALEEAEGTEDSALDFVKKRLGGGSGKDDQRRTLSALQRRGFSYDEARSAINRYLESLEEQG